ncbi:MAG: hypothetical protein WAW41_05360 [Methylobacter sp.]
MKNEKNQQSINDTLTERGLRYGPFDGHAAITQALKRVMVGDIKLMEPDSSTKHVPCTNWRKLSPSQKEALEMIAHKIGRILNGDPNYSDSWHDIAGYAQLVEMEILANEK